MYNVYRSGYDRKIQNELMEKLKLEQEIIKLTQYVEFRSNFIANLDKEQKKLFLKNEKKWLKNRFTNTAGINKRYIKNLLYKEPKSWSLTERKTVFILKAFYEYEISNLK
jgi:predicted naringenin-chalcone synthase